MSLWPIIVQTVPVLKPLSFARRWWHSVPRKETGLAVDATIYNHNWHLLKLKSFIKTIEKGLSWENWIQEVDLEDQFSGIELWKISWYYQWQTGRLCSSHYWCVQQLEMVTFQLKVAIDWFRKKPLSESLYLKSAQSIWALPKKLLTPLCPLSNEHSGALFGPFFTICL